LETIDSEVESVLRTYPVARQAALAIVKGTKLVYARGYSFSEADWPQTPPTAYFRFASLSKTVTALAIFQGDVHHRREIGIPDRYRTWYLGGTTEAQREAPVTIKLQNAGSVDDLAALLAIIKAATLRGHLVQAIAGTVVPELSEHRGRPIQHRCESSMKQLTDQ
jgi:Beta-lactamase